MTIKKAKELAQKWIQQKPSPKELDPGDVEDVLSALDFEFIKKLTHTAYVYKHECLEGDENNFRYCKMTYHLGHSAKQNKAVVRIGSVRIIIKALECYFDWLERTKK